MDELLGKAIPAKEEGGDRRARQSNGKPVLWEGKHWKAWSVEGEALAAATEQASPTAGATVPHMQEALDLKSSEVLVFCFC